MALELTSCLKGKAVGVLSDLYWIERVKYSSLVNALKDRFDPDNPDQLYKAQLKSRMRQQSKESLPKLAQDIKRLIKCSHPQLTVDLHDG